jgi:phosphohistidine phosphatase SixA
MVTVLLVRHADVDLPPACPDPGLNSDGQARARALANVAGSAGVSNIFTSMFIRTKQTVKPLADQLSLQPREVPRSERLDALAQQILTGQLGEVILIAGHSNTVPKMVSALGAAPVPTIGEREFDNLFILTVLRPGKVGFVRLRYGTIST